ncbi:MAG: hypothetical protein AB8G99_24420 [Planctomycetaceae bacterium]
MLKLRNSLFGLGLAFVSLGFVGCADEKGEDFTPYEDAAESDGSHGGHSHAHEEGPHGGKILELADDHSVHGELCLNEDGKSMTFYVLGGDLKTPKPAESIKFEIEEEADEKVLPSTPSPLEGEEDGKCSRFTIDASSLGSLDLDHMEAHVHVMIDGTEFEGGLEHDHDHGDHGDHDGHGHDEGGDDPKDGHDDHAGHDHDKEGHDHKEGEHADK